MLTKRCIAIFLCLLLLTSLAACGTQTPATDPTVPTDPPVPVDPTDSTPAEPVTSFTQAELKAIEEYLNDPVNNGFVHHNEYTSPKKMDLFDVFYDGAGINVALEQWAEGEAQAVLDATGWESFYNPPTKIPREAANAFLQEKCGLTLEDFQGEIRGFRYVEAYDAFYHIHGDLNFASVTVIGGGLDKDGRCIVHYTALRPTAPEYQLHPVRHTVTLLKNDSGYQFVSNVKNETPTEAELKAIEAYLNDPANAGLISDNENPFPADASVTVVSGEIDMDGRYIIQYAIDSRNFTLTLLKTDSGYQIVSNLENIPLTEEELKSLQDYLNQSENLGFWGYNKYDSPKEIDLKGVFYDGAGMKLEIDQWAEGEKEAVLAATGWQEFFVPPAKIPREAANALLMEKTGLSLDDFGGEIPHFHYVEAYDAYYCMHGDIYNARIELSSGVRNKDGLYIIQYLNSTLTLQKTDTGFRFLSNFEHIDPSPDLEEPFLSILADGGSYYSTSRKEEARITDCTSSLDLYTIVDLDGDGQPEVAIERRNLQTLILRNVNGSVIGFDIEESNIRLNKDGSFEWGKNYGYTTGCSALRFSDSQCEIVELFRIEKTESGSATYYVDGKLATEAEYLAVADAERELVDWLHWFIR